jgi:hypothetical protein
LSARHHVTTAPARPSRSCSSALAAATCSLSRAPSLCNRCFRSANSLRHTSASCGPTACPTAAALPRAPWPAANSAALGGVARAAAANECEPAALLARAVEQCGSRRCDDDAPLRRSSRTPTSPIACCWGAVVGIDFGEGGCSVPQLPGGLCPPRSTARADPINAPKFVSPDWHAGPDACPLTPRRPAGAAAQTRCRARPAAAPPSPPVSERSGGDAWGFQIDA